LWSQKCAELSYKWGTLDMKEDLLQEPRPMFKGEYKISKVTNRLEPHYSDWKRALFRYFVTLPCLVLTIAFTIITMLIMFKVKDYFSMAIESNTLPGIIRNSKLNWIQIKIKVISSLYLI
jgi:hypothetical protein